MRGHELFIWCGFDALFVPILGGEQAKVASTCPVTGTPIRLSVESDGTVLAATPAEVVVAIVGEAALLLLHGGRACLSDLWPDAVLYLSGGRRGP